MSHTDENEIEHVQLVSRRIPNEKRSIYSNAVSVYVRAAVSHFGPGVRDEYSLRVNEFRDGGVDDWLVARMAAVTRMFCVNALPC